jgi:hypothetical protein
MNIMQRSILLILVLICGFSCLPTDDSDPPYADPVPTTLPCTDISTSAATMQASFTNPDHAPILTMGFVWGTDTLPVTETGKIRYPADLNASILTGSLSGLTSKTVYHYRLFIKLKKGTLYGSDVRFVTK